MKILILIFFFLEIKESKITRGHNYTLVKKQSRLDVRKYSFSQRTINVWNNLSTDCVHASSVNMFKNKIDSAQVKTKNRSLLRNSVFNTEDETFTTCCRKTNVTKAWKWFITQAFRPTLDMKYCLRSPDGSMDIWASSHSQLRVRAGRDFFFKQVPTRSFWVEMAIGFCLHCPL